MKDAKRPPVRLLITIIIFFFESEIDGTFFFYKVIAKDFVTWRKLRKYYVFSGLKFIKFLLTVHTACSVRRCRSFDSKFFLTLVL